MGRRTHERVFKIRYKGDFGFRSRTFLGKPNIKIPGRVLKVRKVSEQEIFHTGEYNHLPETLMREFNKNRRLATT